MNIRLRISGILLLVFMAVFFDFRKGELSFEMLTGICENYNFLEETCISGEQLDTVKYDSNVFRCSLLEIDFNYHFTRRGI